MDAALGDLFLDDDERDPIYDEYEPYHAGSGVDNAIPEVEPAPIPPTQPDSSPPRSVLPIVLETLNLLKGHGLDLATFLYAISWGDPECRSDATVKQVRTNLMQSRELMAILRNWNRPPRTGSKGRRAAGASAVFEEFMGEYVRGKIDEEMEETVPIFTADPKDVTEASLTNIKYTDMIDEAKRGAPFIWDLLTRLTTTARQRKENKVERSELIGLNMLSQAHYSRSQRCAKLPKLHAIYLRANGMAARGFDFIHLLGICMSHRWTIDAYRELASQKMEEAKEVARGPRWIISHDNVNIPMRVFSQRLHNQNHFYSATAMTLWTLPEGVTPLSDNVRRDLEARRAQNSGEMFDINSVVIMDDAKRNRIRAQYINHILHFLLDHPKFKSYEHKSHDALKEPPPVEQLPTGSEWRTTQHILRTCDIEEATYEGTDKVVTEAFRQLGLDSEEEKKKTSTTRVIPWLGDQLSVSRLRGLFRLHGEDLNGLERFDFSLPTFGWFHLMMAYGNSLHDQYLGTAGGVGNLRHAFDLLQRKGLVTQSTKGPFWHHLDEALYHTGEAHFLALWLHVGKVESIPELLTRSPEDLYQMAETIHDLYASQQALKEIGEKPLKDQDQVLLQAIRFNSDILGYFEIRSGSRRGDVGRLEDLLPTLLCRFSGGGNSNYAIELLELFQGMKQEWPPEIWTYIKRNCWLFSRTGEPDSYLPFDLGQEQNIGDIKVTFKAQGPGGTLSYLTDTSPAIPILRKVKDCMNDQFSILSGRGTHHSSPSKDNDVETLVQSYQLSKIYEETPGRLFKSTDDYSKDVVTIGAGNLIGGSASVTKWFTKRTHFRAKMEDWRANVGDTSSSEESGHNDSGSDENEGTQASSTSGSGNSQAYGSENGSVGDSSSDDGSEGSIIEVDM
ncbi:hypothetical protein ONZ45_g19356 [Pleurotus djamor]|nr:hypothetical protein ONZ45_g19356 [Pleurotus djamor]